MGSFLKLLAQHDEDGKGELDTGIHLYTSKSFLKLLLKSLQWIRAIRMLSFVGAVG